MRDNHTKLPRLKLRNLLLYEYQSNEVNSGTSLPRTLRPAAILENPGPIRQASIVLTTGPPRFDDTIDLKLRL